MKKIIEGDCLESLRNLADNSINCCITSPPYWGLRDYGTANWEGGKSDCNHSIPETEKDPKNPNAGSHISRFNRDSCYKCGAKRNNRNYIGTELNPEYIKIAEKRISLVTQKLF